MTAEISVFTRPIPNAGIQQPASEKDDRVTVVGQTILEQVTENVLFVWTRTVEGLRTAGNVIMCLINRIIEAVKSALWPESTPATRSSDEGGSEQNTSPTPQEVTAATPPPSPPVATSSSAGTGSPPVVVARQAVPRERGWLSFFWPW